MFWDFFVKVKWNLLTVRDCTDDSSQNGTFYLCYRSHFCGSLQAISRVLRLKQHLYFTRKNHKTPIYYLWKALSGTILTPTFWFYTGTRTVLAIGKIFWNFFVKVKWSLLAVRDFTVDSNQHDTFYLCPDGCFWSVTCIHQNKTIEFFLWTPHNCVCRK